MQARVAGRLDGRHHRLGELAGATSPPTWACPPSGIEVIPVGIDPDEFTPAAGRTGRATPTRSWSSPAPTSPLKGLVHLLEALAKLRTERPVRLTVVGTARPGGPAEAALDRLALRDAVRFTGPVPEAELVDLLQRAAVVAIPSLYEGFSLPGRRGHGLRDAAGHHRRRRPARGGRQRGGPAGARRRRRRADRRAAAGARLPRAGRAARPGRPAPGAGPYTWRSTAQRTADWYAEVLRPEGTAVLTVDYDRLDLRPGMTVLDLGLRRGPARLRGLPPRRARSSPSTGASPRSRRRSAGWARSPRPARRRHGARYEVVRGDLLRAALPRRQRRPGDRLGGARAHPGRRHRDRRDRPRAQARRPGRGDRAALRARADLLGAVGRVPRQRGRAHPHLHGAACCGPGWPSVGLVPGGSHHAHALHAPFWWLKCAVGVDRDAAARPRLPPAAGLGPHEAAVAHPHRRAACSTRCSARAWSSTPTSPARRAARGAGAGGGAPSEWERTAAAR